ncbi:hypothetical protein D9613_005680 [Agrocybe pediades]|uniref:Uncharacterized protein n=1 Tax=Agrocybe pediades TaxID=84607 RepID=A0A8H4QU08_9AGAR|nr:hypothetical protein D9613_005680 [Agrocybe pediades]
MIFFHLAIISLLSTLWSFCLGVTAMPCMPCQASHRRATALDQMLPPRGLYSPKITNPTNESLWTVGSDVTVTWDLRDMLKNTTNPKGTILLGYLEDGSDEEHLNIKHPLASGFDIKEGFVTFKCPKVDSRKDYIVVLFGDSGNRSPTFTIQK